MAKDAEESSQSLGSAPFWVILVPPSRAKKSDFLTLEDGTNTLSRNVGKGFPLDAAL
jgi:hypothetical protein